MSRPRTRTAVPAPSTDPAYESRARFYVVPRYTGYGVRDRATGSIVADCLTRQEAWLDVWKRNGRRGYPPALARAEAARA